MNKTQTIGLISELVFTKRCLELGHQVFMPVGIERFDLLLRMEQQFFRIQVKTGRLVRGSIIFNTCSNAEGIGKRVNYEGHADHIGIFTPELDRCFLVPLEECPRVGGSLRVEPPKNGQAKRIRWADDYSW